MWGEIVMMMTMLWNQTIMIEDQPMKLTLSISAINQRVLALQPSNDEQLPFVNHSMMMATCKRVKKEEEKNMHKYYN